MNMQLRIAFALERISKTPFLGSDRVSFSKTTEKEQYRRYSFVEVYRILADTAWPSPSPSEVVVRVFCITLYANETYALAAAHNKLLV